MSLEEVKDHKWYNGPVASEGEIITSFNVRKLQIQKLGKFKITKAKKDKDKPKKKTEGKSKKIKKFTKFFIVDDGELLIDALIEYAEKKKTEYVKSEDYYRVEIKYIVDKVATKTIVNVVKNPDGESRCLEFIMRSGDKAVFDKIFASYKKHVKTLYEYESGQ
jgi:hypothetical protein